MRGFFCFYFFTAEYGTENYAARLKEGGWKLLDATGCPRLYALYSEYQDLVLDILSLQENGLEFDKDGDGGYLFYIQSKNGPRKKRGGAKLSLKRIRSKLAKIQDSL